MEKIRYQYIMCRKSISCTQLLRELNHKVQFYTVMTMYHIWTASYMLNQTHILTSGSEQTYRYDDKDLKPFFAVNFEDRYRFKTVAAGNYVSSTKLNYYIGKIVA